MSPSNPHTQRYGINASLIWQVSDNHSIRAAYTLDWARHRQTGAYGTIDYADPEAPTFTNPFGGRNGETVTNLDGYDLRSRDRLSYATLDQFALEYRGRYFDDAVRVNLGVRAPYFERELNQYCLSRSKSNAVLCTSQDTTVSPNATDANPVVRVAGSSVDYILPYSRTVTFDDILPNLNVNWQVAGPHSVYASYAESLTLPRTDNLYTVYYDENGDITSPIAEPETSKTFDVGYRYQSGVLIASANVWYTKFQNRILSTYDQETGISADRNVGDVDLYGFDSQLGFSPIAPLSIYLTASYTDSEIKSDYVTGTETVAVGGKSLVEVPDWTFGMRVNYVAGPLSLGAQAKYVGERWLTDVNDVAVPSYTTVNADARFDLGYFGMQGAELAINVINLLDEEYFGSLGTGTDYTSGLYASQGAPRTIQASVRYAF